MVMTYLEWWSKWFSNISGYENEASDFYKITGQAYEKKGLWPVAKLITLAYYLPAYLEIIKDHFSKIYFIDACSGCGLLKVEKRLFLGSALLAERAKAKSGRMFDKIILIDSNSESSCALEKISDKARTHVINGDLNVVLPEVLNQLNNDDKSHFMIFIDPEGMTEVNWATMERILSSKGDVAFNYMCSMIAREVRIPNVENTMNNFFGDDGWKRCNNSENIPECLFSYYMKKVLKLKSASLDVMVKTEGAFHYHIIFGFKSGKWMRIIEDVKEKIEKVTPSDLAHLLTIHEGVQKTLG